MSNANAQVAVFDTHPEISAALRQVRASGFDMDRVSVAGKDQRSHSRVTGYYRAGVRMKYWGELDALWNDVFEILSGWAFFAIPDVGPVLVAGPLADWIAMALSNAPIFGSMSAIGMGLHSVGISRNGIQRYEEALKEGKYLLLVNGPALEVKRVKETINGLWGPVA